MESTQRRNKPESEGIETNDFAGKGAVQSPRRFLPQPVETVARTNRKPAPELTPEPSPKSTSMDNGSPRPVRRFAPQLIETSVRSKKKGSGPATLPTDKTDITPGTNHIYAEKKQKALRRPTIDQLRAPENTPTSSTERVAQILPRAPRKQMSMRPHTNTRRSTRRMSFIPSLEPIESNRSAEQSSDEEHHDDEDDDEDEHYSRTPSLTGSLISSEDSMAKLQLARTRESCDDRFSGYLLELAAKAAEKQLREQALAAFPNSDFHDPVEHFYDREIEGASDDESIGIGLLPHEILDRRESMQGVEVGWAQKEMQQHMDTLERQREEAVNQRLAEQATTQPFKDPFWSNGMTTKPAVEKDDIKEKELQKMRNAASPPMLGDDLKFRMCPSPKATTFETDQQYDVKPSQNVDGGGLWGGYCVADDDQQFLSPTNIKGPTMIATPAVERDDPFASAFSTEVSGKPKSRPPSSKGGVQMLSGIEDRLKQAAEKSKLESAIQDEFDDDFVTQVFNYLSLGYPSLAIMYDEEISKITKIPESELSKEDKQREIQGHIGISEKANKDNKPIDRCPRWKALKMYIVEWARQNPSMEDSAMGPSAWGVRARRGSWAI